MSTVTVGCKLPNGLIIQTGGKKVTLAGTNASRIIGGYGLTTVDKEFYDAWALEYASFAPLNDGLIFVQSSDSKAEGQAREYAELKSGLEPISPESPLPGVKSEAYEGKPAS